MFTKVFLRLVRYKDVDRIHIPEAIASTSSVELRDNSQLTQEQRQKRKAKRPREDEVDLLEHEPDESHDLNELA